MKCNQILPISIGMLLSGCELSQRNTETPGSAVVQSTPTGKIVNGTKTATLTPGAVTTRAYPNYVKPNQGLLSKSATSQTIAPPYIEVRLVPIGNNHAYIQYRITDGTGHAVRWHDKDHKTCENKDSTLFKTTFMYDKDILVETLPKGDAHAGEVKITGYDADHNGNPVIWISSYNTYADDDTTWNQQQ